MNRQIMEFTSVLGSMAERDTSYRREGNDALAMVSLHASRSDRDMYRNVHKIYRRNSVVIDHFDAIGKFNRYNR